MRLNLVTASAVAIAAAMSHHVAYAADVNDQGAKELQGSLTKILPSKIVEKGVVAVTAQTDKYQILFDLPKLMGLYDTPEFSIKQITPVTLFAKPADGGLWKVEGNNDLAVSTTGKGMEGKTSDFSYSIAKMSYDGLFDPAISYFRSGTFTSGAGTIAATDGEEKMTASFSGMNQTISSVAGAAPNTTDFRGTATVKDFKETVFTPQATIDFSMDAMKVDAGAAAVNMQKLRDIFVFIIDNANKQKLDAQDIDKLKGLVREGMPFFTSFDEKIEAENLKVATPQGDFGAKTVSYDMAFGGPLQAAEVKFGIGTDGISLPDGIVPPLYASLVPASTKIDIAVPNLNLQAPVDVLMNADYTKEEPISDAEAAAIGMSVFPGGAYTVNVPNSSFVAPAYDLQISGKVGGSLMQPDRVTVDAVVLARDFDKTMQFVQDLAKQDPQVMQVYLGMTMVKGLAKTDADGRQRWEINVDQNRKVKINGNLLPF